MSADWDHPFLRVPELAGTTDHPYSTHLLRDLGRNLNVLQARIMRPQLISDVYEGAYADWEYAACGGTDPGTLLLSYAAGRGPVADAYTTLDGRILCECAVGSMPTIQATKASFRLHSDARPFDGSFSARMQSAIIAEPIRAAGKLRQGFSALPLVRNDNGATWLTLTAWTDGSLAAGMKPPVQDYGIAYALSVWAVFDEGATT